MARVSWAGGSLVGASRTPLWLDNPTRPESRPALGSDLLVDLLVVGGGLTGLWAALIAAEQNPGRSIAVLEAGTTGWAASGRDVGSVSADLTNGLFHWPDELSLLHRLGRENLNATEQTVHRYGIDCGWTRAVSAGAQLAGLVSPDSAAVVDPARLLRGLAEAAERLGVQIREGTRVLALKDEGTRVAARVATGLDLGLTASAATDVHYWTVRASRIVLATGAFPSPLRRLQPFTVPVWEHALATESLSDRQWDDLGRPGSEVLSDGAHHFRTTADRRVIWAEAAGHYYFGSDLSQRRMLREDVEKLLAEHFFTTFPQVRGLRFSHVWARAVGVSTRGSMLWTQALGRKVAAVAGSVGASRFGAQVALDLLDGLSNERTRLTMVRRPPVPFPPEPLRWLRNRFNDWRRG